MSKIILRRGGTSNILRMFLQDATSGSGAGKTGLTSATVGLVISTITDVEATATVYSQAASTIESIASPGTYVAPTATKCRFKEIDAVNLPGIYEIQIADARFNVANSTQLIVGVQCPTVATVYAEYQFTLVDLLDTVRLGLTALPNVASGSAGSIITSGTGTAQLSVSGGNVTVGTNTDKTGYSLSASQTFSTSGSVASVSGAVGSVAGDVIGKVLGGGAGTITGDGVRAVSVTGDVGGNVTGSVTSVTNPVTVGAINANVITAASIATDAIDADSIKSDVVAEIQSGLSTLTAGQVENAVWDATMSSHTGSTTYGGRIIRAANSNVTAFITGANHMAADIHELQPAVIENTHFAAGAIDTNAISTDAVAEIVDGVWDELRGGTRPAGSFGAYLDGSVAGVQTTVNTINTNTDSVETVTNKLNTMLVQVGAGPNYQYTTQSLSFAPGGDGDINNYVPVTLPFGTNVRHTLTFNVGATLPLREDILQQQDRTPIDLSDADSVVYELMPVEGSSPAVYASAIIVDAVAGRVRYIWQSGDLDTAGTYRERWIVSYATGQIGVFGPLIKVA